MVVETEIVIKLVLAAVIGSLLGFERKIHNRPGGTRTHALVCLGSTLFTITSLGFSGNADPSRIAAGIVTGIGFLGAGTIFKTKNRVLGLTTAAELWTVAAIGIAIGIGLYFTAIATAVIVFIILVHGKRVEEKLVEKNHKNNHKTHKRKGWGV